MDKKSQWMRPDQIKTFRTNDPKKMLGKYLVKNAVKKWVEDFVDEDTGEIVSIERSEIMVLAGYIGQEKLQEIMFAIQSGDIEDVEICNEDVGDITLYVPYFLNNYLVTMHHGMGEDDTYAVQAQTIQKAIEIASAFGQMYRGFRGIITPTKVVPLNARIVPDNHQCIPEEERTKEYERKDYFKVSTRTEYVEDMKLMKFDRDYIIASKEVGQAKERIARLLDIQKAESVKRGERIGLNATTIIRKAMPFEVDCVVPKDFSELYRAEPTRI